MIRKNFLSKGFTLIEVLIAIAMIGILASFIISNFAGIQQKTRDSQRKNDLNQIQTALGLYLQDYGQFPQSTTDGKIENAIWGGKWLPYIKELPEDPLALQNYKNYYYQPDGDSYRLYAKLENCNDSQAKAGTDCKNDYNYCISPNGSCIVAVAISPTPSPIVIPTSKPFTTTAPLPGTKTYTIEGFVFVDTNPDGVMRSYEKCYEGSVTIEILGSEHKTTYTQDVSCFSKYTFTGLRAGSYTVSANPIPPYEFTTPSSVTVTVP